MRSAPSLTAERLDRLYRQYNRRKYVDPDPLMFLYRYDRLANREIVALIALIQRFCI